MTTLSVLLTIVSALLAVPVIAFLAEIVAGLIVQVRGTASPDTDKAYGRLAVLVPAHNESGGMIDTLADIKAQLRPNDRVLVIADNCSDDTAAVALAAGAEVAIRDEPARIGKGYALDFGLRRLAADPPAIVAVIDADCRLGVDALARLASACAASQAPVQALYLMVAPDRSPLNYGVATFAFRVKNWARPLGMSAMRLPCPMTGSGMALPWEIMASVDLATGSIVEDLKLGLDLTAAGHPPVFCPTALIKSEFPSTLTGAAVQRSRWEQGHLLVIARLIPRLIGRAVVERNILLLAAALDAAIPPITFLGMAVCLMAGVSGVSVLFGAPSASLVISAANFFGYVLAIFLGWLKFGRDILPIHAVPSLARYIADKIPLYKKVLARTHNENWIRADRQK